MGTKFLKGIVTKRRPK